MLLQKPSPYIFYLLRPVWVPHDHGGLSELVHLLEVVRGHRDHDDLLAFLSNLSLLRRRSHHYGGVSQSVVLSDC